MTVTRDDWANNPSVLDEIPEDTAAALAASPMAELGVTGLKRAAGIVDEEFLPALRGRRAVAVFREMENNDSMVGALMFTIKQLLRGLEWKVVPSDQTPEAQEANEFLESCMDDMSHSWGDFISEVLSMLVYGFSWHEIVYKKRVGPWEKDAKKKSKYDDGLIGWRKMPIRSQETMMRWVFDESGGIKAMVQLAPPSYQMKTLPIERSLLFRTSVSKGNPEGISLLRTAYRSWYFKKRLEEFEAVGIERDLAGMPVVHVPSSYLNANADSQKKKMVESMKKMVRGVRRDENEGLIMPRDFDDNGNPLFEFSLMTSGGTRTFDTNTIISRYEQRILMSVLADFILVGHQGTGSYALHTDKTGIFRAAINSIAESIADVLNRHAVPRLFEVNAWKLRELPRIVPQNVDPPDLTQLSQFISSTSAAGMEWFPDPELEKFIRSIARLPEMSDETLEFKREQIQVQQAMQEAEGQMGILGMKQKAEMTAQGFSPEQAEMASQQPTSEMATAEQATQLDAEEALQDHPALLRQKEEEQAMMEQQAAQEEQGALRESEEKDKDRQMQLTMEEFKARQQQKNKPPAKPAPRSKR